jgi:prephenate dehydrogenase
MFCIPHLRPFFDVAIHDSRPDAAARAAGAGVRAVTLEEAAGADVVVLAVPLEALEAVARRIAPHLRPGRLVVDVCSLKMRPAAILSATLPAHVDIVGTHPLFGPQSGRDGIAGLRAVVCPVRGARHRVVAAVLRRLGLHVIRTSPEAHDRQMAYVQGLTHLLARVVIDMDLPPLDQTTTTFDHLARMVATVRHDSDALFRTIVRDNPFAAEMRQRLRESVLRLTEDAEAARAALRSAA